MSFFCLIPEMRLEKNIPAAEMLDSGEDVKKVVHYQSLFYVLEIIKSKLTSHFGIKKSSKTNIKPLIDLDRSRY